MAVSDTAQGTAGWVRWVPWRGHRREQHSGLRPLLHTPVELLLGSRETFLFQQHLENTLQKE